MLLGDTVLHNPDKVRDMTRPHISSSRRKGVRDDFRAVHRHHRHDITEHLSQYAGAPTSAVTEDVLDDPFDFEKFPTAKINYIARERRHGQKASRVIRWATAATDGADLTSAERLAAVNRALPNTSAGDRTLRLIGYGDAFSEPRLYSTRWNRRYPTSPEARLRMNFRTAGPEGLTAIVERTLAEGLHKQFNTHMKHYAVLWTRPSSETRYGVAIQERRYVFAVLYGAHDVEDFVRFVFARPTPPEGEGWKIGHYHTPFIEGITDWVVRNNWVI